MPFLNLMYATRNSVSLMSSSFYLIYLYSIKRIMKQFIPPFLFIICIVVMIIAGMVSPAKALISFPLNLFGIIILALGLAMVVSMARLFGTKQTEIHTFKTPRKLVSEGLFRYSRNPIYLGFTVALVGVWILLGGQMVSGIGVVIFFVAANFWYIPFEENNLKRTFGDEYLVYKKKVRRWL